MSYVLKGQAKFLTSIPYNCDHSWRWNVYIFNGVHCIWESEPYKQ